MADATITLIIEGWIRQNFLQKKYGQEFKKRKLTLSPGGEFEFDAVSEDESIVASISTSAAKTASGKLAPGPYRKILADILYLTMIDARHNVKQRLIIFTEKDLYERFEKENKDGRIPKEIQLLLFKDIPVDLRKQLVDFQRKASKEVSPLW